MASEILPEQPVTFGISPTDKSGTPISAAAYELVLVCKRLYCHQSNCSTFFPYLSHIKGESFHQREKKVGEEEEEEEEGGTLRPIVTTGTKIEPNSKFCSHCGKPASLAAPPTAGSGTSDSSSRARNTRSKKKIAGIVILVIIGIFGGLLALSVAVVGTGVITPPSNTSA